MTKIFGRSFWAAILLFRIIGAAFVVADGSISTMAHIVVIGLVSVARVVEVAGAARCFAARRAVAMAAVAAISWTSIGVCFALLHHKKAKKKGRDKKEGLIHL